ncbi:MAG: hypothetical protein D6B25_17555 [Desulfobulbaceae bacterium]|nr:MAG: hypothetical protein D6B25_17555 [Desulfobulbaceae bacterium]
MIRLKSGRLVIDRDIASAAEIVWDCLTDTRLWKEWGPSVSEVVCDHQYIKQAVQGRIRTAMGFWVSFSISEYRHLSFWQWRVAGYRATGHTLETLGPQSCRLAFDMPLLAAPYLFICYLALRRIERLCLEK